MQTQLNYSIKWLIGYFYSNVEHYQYNYGDLNNINNYNLKLNEYIACFSSSVYTNLNVILLKTYEILAAGSLLVMPITEEIYLQKIGLYNMQNCYLIDFTKDIQQQINNIFAKINTTNKIRLNGYYYAKSNFTSFNKFIEINKIINR